MTEVVRWTIALALLLIVFFGLAYRVAGLQRQIDDRSAARSTLGTEDQQLFFDLIRTGLLRPRDDGGLEMAPSDYLLVQQVEGNEPPEGISRGEQERYLKALYYSSVGVIVRQQVRLWNESRRIAAIRDDRPGPPDETPRNEWDAFSSTGHPLRTGDLVPETFGFVHRGELRAGYTDWLTVANEQERITYRTRIRVQEPRTITIQVVGNPVEIPDGARVERMDAPEHLHRNWPCDVAPQAAVISMRVAPAENGVPAAVTVEPAVNCAPRVFGLAIRLEQVSEETGDADEQEEAGRDGAGTPDPEADREGDAAGRQQTGAGDQTETGMTSASAAFEGWVYRWRPVPRRSRTAGSFTVYTGDGIALTDPSGSGDPTDAAVDLGLLNLVGFGPADSTSLIGLLRRSRLPADNLEVRLTIDSRIQRAAQESLNHWERVWASNRFGDERKGAVVVLDADTGAVLAAANWPLPPAGARPWDYAAFAHTNPLRDPMSIFGWEVSDKHNTPGSTFKPVVSMALMSSGRDRILELVRGVSPERFATLTRDRWGRVLTPTTGAYYPGTSDRSIPNFGGGGMSGYFSHPSRHPECEGYAPELREFADPGRPPRFGVTQAVQGSFNVWFARMAVMLDRPTIEQWVEGLETRDGWTLGPSSPPETELIEFASRLGIDPEQRLDLAANLPPDSGLFRLDTETGADILYSALPSSILLTEDLFPQARPPGILDLTFFMLAQNGFGQSWSVTPLHMAGAAVAAGTGRVVQPHIFSNWAGRALSAPEGRRLDISPDLFALLREGMKAVTEAGHSTAGYTFRAVDEYIRWQAEAAGERAAQRAAQQGLGEAEQRQAARNAAQERRNRLTEHRQALREMRCRTYGKTGTADISQRERYNSGWFIGWMDPAEEGGRRLAFACMTTHVIDAGSMRRFGGSTCGRIIRDTLLRIEEPNMLRASRQEEDANERAESEQEGREERAQTPEGSERRAGDRAQDGSDGGGERDRDDGSIVVPGVPSDRGDSGGSQPRNSP